MLIFAGSFRRHIKQKMKNLLVLIALIFSSVSGARSQCEVEPTVAETGKIIHTKKFGVPFETNSAAKIFLKMTGALQGAGRENEMFLLLEASAADASWLTKNAEAAVLTVFVDGVYNQDVILFAGAKKFKYPVNLGKFERGEHELVVVLNAARSALNVRKVKLFSARIYPSELALVKNGGDARDFLALTRAPILYARPDTINQFSDVPLLVYYEILSPGGSGADAYKIRYTAIYSNEDGGTQTAALMARWGRATDIEWVYEIEIKNGAVVSEIYQGANHETKTFAGRKIFGEHPLLFDVTVNNNFADSGCSALRFAPLPVRADLSKKSRESVMDENAWTYRVMAEEAAREGRVDRTKLGANVIADPRDYLYAEIYGEPENAAVNVEARISETEKYSSDAGFEQLRVNRPGYVRIALRLPPERAAEFPATISVGCYAHSGKSAATKSACRNVRLIKLIRLDRDYSPIVKNFNGAPQSIENNQRAVFRFKKSVE